MQLKKKTKKKAIRGALTTASCTLLGLTNVAQAENAPWQFDAGVLYYSETDRVQALEPVVTGKKDFGDDRWLNLKLVVDLLTGASPNGATPTNAPQTFTRPSGKGSYTIDANETPLDDTFRDTRVAVSGSWEQPLGERMKGSFGASFSTEHDFLSMGASASLAYDMNKRNTTLSAGVSFESDTITPEGGIPTPFASMASAGSTQPRDASEDTRTLVDLLFGVTQVINRNMLMQVNYGISTSSGYHTDPYKILSVVDGTTGATTDYVYEHRPDSRNKQSLYWQMKYHLTEDIIDVSYRYLWDDWGVTSHTIDATYRWDLGGAKYLEPHVRYYQQSAADFYRLFLIDGAPLPAEASADYRLAEFTGITLGLKYGMQIKGHDTSLRLEYLAQTGDSSPSEAIGVLQDQDLYPDLKAVMLQFRYAF